jgi:hypothetical protein
VRHEFLKLLPALSFLGHLLLRILRDQLSVGEAGLHDQVLVHHFQELSVDLILLLGNSAQQVPQLLVPVQVLSWHI